MRKKSLLGCLGVLLFSVVIVCCLLMGIRVGIAPGYLAGVNISTDPFGVFGDRHLHWWSYNETQNPKVAKFQYLKQHHEDFDSYIIGGSEAGAYPVDAFNDFFDARFYNLALYDADMRVSEQYCKYLLEHYEVKNIVLNVSLANGLSDNGKENGFLDAMPYQLSDESAFAYYRRYLFADPRYGKEKLQCQSQNGYLRQDFDVFDANTGSFDTRQEDSVRIGDVPSYLQENANFDYNAVPRHELTETEACMKRVAAIRELCDKHHVNLIVIAAPMYQGYVSRFDQGMVEAFYKKLAEVTPYWDFSWSALSQDPRYFYDETHFRKFVGRMVAARITDAPSVYVPDGFGVYMDEGHSYGGSVLDGYDTFAPEENNARKVPILMYHHLVEGNNADNWDIMTVSRFKAQMKAMRQAGYTAVTFDDLRQYVNAGVELPEKPVVITFDDGYSSNYSLAMPILEEFDMKATIFMIGATVGQDTYKDTGHSMAPHFSWEEAKEMEASGLIDIESHGYDVHEVLGLDDEPIRDGCLQMEGESEATYVDFLSKDCQTMRMLFEEYLGQVPRVLAYPYGKYTALSETVFADEGFDITLSVEPGNSLVIKGMPQSLKAMKRHFVKEETTPQELLSMMQS